MYTFSFGAKIVKEFENAHPRGWAFFLRKYPTFNSSEMAKLFCKSQENPGPWNIAKACVKLADRITTQAYSENTPEFDAWMDRNVQRLKKDLLIQSSKSVKFKEHQKRLAAVV